MLIDRTTGICLQRHISKTQLIKLRQLLQARGWYSGDRCYPIEHPTKLVDPQAAYLMASDDLWDESCPYCQRRIAIYKELMACSEK